MRGVKRRWVVIGALLTVAALAAPFLIQRTVVFYTDGADLRERASTAQRLVREILWEPPRGLGEDINHPELDDYEPCVSPSGGTLVFTRGRPGENADLWVAYREDERNTWGAPRPVEALNTAADELGASFTADGAWLYFYSDRDGGEGGYDIWASPTLKEGGGQPGWGEPVHLGPAINSAWNETNPAPDPTGRKLYFTSDRRRGEDPPWKATMRARLEAADYDIYVALRESESEAGDGQNQFIYQAAQPYEPLNQARSAEGAVAISPVGDFLYFASNRPGGEGGFDLYRIRLADGWLPESLGPIVNSSADELDPALSTSGFELFYSSNRNGQEDIFVSLSREVFRNRESDGPYLSFAALLSFLAELARLLLPYLLWFLVLLLCLALVQLLRKFRRRLNLLARCFLLALLIHFLLAFWMNKETLDRFLYEAVGDGSDEAAFEVSLEGMPEEKVGFAIREELAETSASEAAILHSDRRSLDSPSEETVVSVSAFEPPLSPPPQRQLLSADVETSRPLPIVRLEESALEMKIPKAAEALSQPLVRSRPMETMERSPVETESVSLGPWPSRRKPPISEAREAELTVIQEMDAVATGEKIADALVLPDLKGPSPMPMRAAIEDRQVSPAPPPRPADPKELTPTVAMAPREHGAAVLEEPRSRTSPLLGRETPARLTRPESDPLGRPESALSLERPQRQSVLEPSRVALSSTRVARGAVKEARLAQPAVPARQEGLRPSPKLSALASKRRTPSQPSAVQTTQATRPLSLTTSMRRHRSPPQPETRSRLEEPLAQTTRPLDAAAFREPTSERRRLKEKLKPLALATKADLRIPTAEPERRPRNSRFLPRIYRLRKKSMRDEVLKERGGSPQTEAAVKAGLAWLALHQSPDGRWSLTHYVSHLRDPSARDLFHRDWSGRGRYRSQGGNGKARNGDTAATGLALLAFLGHGDTHLEEGPYRDNVERGIRWLRAAQKRNGDLRGGGNMYMHAIASFALCEAYAFTKDPALREPAQRAIDFTVKTQNPVSGGWRYDPYPQGRDVDTSVFGWMLMALKSGLLGGLDVDKRCLRRAAAYLESARMSGGGGGRFAYQPGSSRTSLAMTAQGFFCQQMLADTLLTEEEKESEFVRRVTQGSVDYLLSNLPRPRDMGGVNFYYWYYATLALFQEGGLGWETWNGVLSDLLVEQQVGEEHGTAHGSWDPRGRRAETGGRLYSTALSILCLEVYYRYAPLSESGG